VTTYRNPSFVLGTIIGGKEYHFTDLPRFKTYRAARDYADAKERVGLVVVFKEEDAYRHGVNFGTRSEVVTA
jgi:hypothetical protein